jgi:hypothetical protein
LKRCSPNGECSISLLQEGIHIKQCQKQRENYFVFVENQKQKSLSSQKGSPQRTNERASKFKDEEVVSVKFEEGNCDISMEKQRAWGLRVQNLRLNQLTEVLSPDTTHARAHTNKQIGDSNRGGRGGGGALAAASIAL